ncbi:MAG: Wzz/FepE/Etk N-terminal domain-containing protein [Devosiaceae bacterium]
MQPTSEVWDLLSFLRQHLRLILLCGLAGLIASLGITALIVPTYTATALVLVDTSAQRQVDLRNASQTLPLATGVVSSHVEVLRSGAMMHRVVDNLGLSENNLPSTPFRPLRWLQSGQTASADQATQQSILAARLRDAITVERRNASFVIALEVANADPLTASRIANGLADAYLSEQVEAKVAAALAAHTALAARVDDLAMELRIIEAHVDDTLLQAAANTIERTSSNGTSIDTSLVEALSQLSRHRDALFDEYSAITIALRQVEHQRLEQPAFIDTSYLSTSDEAERANQARQEEINAELAALNDAAHSARQNLRQHMDVEAFDTSLALDLIRFQQEAQTTRGVYLSTLERMKEARTNASVQVADARILSRASIPTQTSSPLGKLIAAIGLLTGFAAGAGVGWLQDQAFAGIIDAIALERDTGLETVAHVPLIPKADSAEPFALVTTRPNNPFTEAVRRVALASDAYRPPASALVTLITSCNENEGKSSLAHSYARLAAASGKRTLMIDADFRKAKIYRSQDDISQARSNQFSDLLLANEDPDEILIDAHRDGQTGLNILGNVRPPKGASDAIIASQQFARFIDTARQRFDLIVIDSPPIIPIVDARILLRYADIAVLVMRYGVTTSAQVQEALREMDQPDAPRTLGALSFVDPKSRFSAAPAYYGSKA